MSFFQTAKAKAASNIATEKCGVDASFASVEAVILLVSVAFWELADVENLAAGVERTTEA